jgi:hypothetical protein
MQKRSRRTTDVVKSMLGLRGRIARTIQTGLAGRFEDVAAMVYARFVKTIRDRPWLLPVGAAAIAICLFIAGVVVWRMMPPQPSPPLCPAHALCGFLPESSHRLHPVRAELLWAASGLFSIIALSSALRSWRRGDHLPAAA